VTGPPDAAVEWPRAGWLLALLTASALIPLWLADPLPLQDLPNHLLKVDLLRRHLAGDQAVREVYALDFGPVPNLLCYAVLLALSPFMGFQPAAKVFVAACVASLPLATYLWVRAHNRPDTVLALAAPGIAYTAFLSKGMLNFAAALPLYLGCLLAVSRNPFRRRDVVLVCGLASLLYLTHGFVFVVLVVASLGIVVLDMGPWREAARRLGGLLPGLVLLAVWLSRGLARPGLDESAGWRWSLDIMGRVWAIAPWLFGFAHGSAFALLWLAVMAGVLAYTCVVLAGDLVRGGRIGPVVRRHRFLALALVMGLTFLVGPEPPSATGAVRWLPLIALTALAGLRLPAPRAVRAVVAVLLVASAVGLHVRNAQAYAAGSAAVRAYVSGLAAVEPGASLLPIDREDPPFGQRVNLHSWAYYQIGRGGWAPYLHAYRNRHPIVYRAHPWAPAEGAKAPLDPETVRRVAACYDYVLLWDAASNGAAELAAGFELVHDDRRLHIWQNRAGVGRRPPIALPACVDNPAADLP
jgi:hypothetical protein